jgi:hypothetical protein
MGLEYRSDCRTQRGTEAVIMIYFPKMQIRKPGIKKVLLGSAGIIGVLLVGFIDHATGYEWSFSIFYFAPIIFSVSYVNFPFGIFISVLSAVTWFIALFQ